MHHLTKKQVVLQRKNTQPLLFTAEELAADRKNHSLGLTIHRNAQLDVKHEVRKYSVFAAKTALGGLKMALKGIEYGLSDMIEAAEHQRKHKADMAKQGVLVKYTLF